jgi:hypothetical protein
VKPERMYYTVYGTIHWDNISDEVYEITAVSLADLKNGM